MIRMICFDSCICVDYKCFVCVYVCVGGCLLVDMNIYVYVLCNYCHFIQCTKIIHILPDELSGIEKTIRFTIMYSL